MNKMPESLIKAQKSYRKRVSGDEEKRSHRNYLSARRSAKSFIRNHATGDDLIELESLIEKQKEILNR